jgi:hypothetical protein
MRIGPGDAVPDYELPDHESLPRRLSEIQGDDPLILTLARGHHCPEEHQQDLELAANYPKINIKEYTDPDKDPMITHTLVLKPGLVVHSDYNGYRFGGRSSLDEFWRDLREGSREIRPNWDLNAPGLREAWDAGDLAPFHGWNRRISTPRSVEGAVR